MEAPSAAFMARAGTPFFPALDAPIRLRLVETRRFGSGVTLLRYARA